MAGFAYRTLRRQAAHLRQMRVWLAGLKSIPEASIDAWAPRYRGLDMNEGMRPS